MKKENKFLIILFILTNIKLILFYNFTVDKISSTLIITSVSWVLVVYFIMYILKKNYNFRYLIVYSITSFFIFSDLIYYEYYTFFPSIKALSLLDQVGAVKDSVFSLIKPIHLLFIIDIIPLIFISMKLDKNIKNKFLVKRKYLFALSLVIISILTTFSFPSQGNELYVFNNYGVFNYHITDIVKNTFFSVSENIDEDNSTTRYKNSQETNANHFGIAKNRNVILIQLESFQDFLINREYNGQELTPNLNKLIEKDSIYFNNYFQQVGVGNTSDSEFITENSMHSLGTESVFNDYSDNTFYSLPVILKNQGYETMAFHGFKRDFWNRSTIYPNLGIDKYVGFEDFKHDEFVSIGLSDESFYRQTVDILETIDKPYYAKIISLSSHHPYEIPDSKKSLNLLTRHKDTMFGNYLQAVHYADKALGKFIDDLKKDGLYENTIIALYGDHSGLYPNHEENTEYMSEYLGYEYDYDEILNIPLIFHIPGSDITETNSIVGGQIDFLPTLINLLGLKEDKEILFGKDLNNTHKGFVALQYYVPKGSFIDDEKLFIMSSDGLFENSRAFSLNTRKDINIDSLKDDSKKAIDEINLSNQFVKENKLKKILNNYK